MLRQQARFDDFIACYNTERPHQALNMACPAEQDPPSTRPYDGRPELNYPFHDKEVTVTTCGRICLNAARSTSARSSPARKSESARLRTAYGSSALCTTISATSTTRPAGWSPSQILRSYGFTHVSGINRHLCVRTSAV
jgi:hypothetical protein